MCARDNPFRTERILTVRYQFTEGLDWPTLFARLETLRYRAAIVGPKGSGKTTLQEDLAARLEDEGHTIRWLRLNTETRHTARQQIKSLLQSATTGDLLFVDGAEQLSLLRWHRFARLARAHAGLVITTHTPGRLPALTTCHTSLELLESIVNQLTSPTDRPSQCSLEELYTKHNGNLRLCLRDLYDEWATTTRPQRQKVKQ